MRSVVSLSHATGFPAIPYTPYAHCEGLEINMHQAANTTPSCTQVPTQTRVVRVQASQQPAPQAVPVVQRRHALGLLAATGACNNAPLPNRHPLHTVAGAALTLANAAQAIDIPSQSSTGGLGKKGLKSNPSASSMEGYNMEGTKKQGISRKRKDKILAKTKERALAVGSAPGAAKPTAPKAKAS